MALFVGRLPPSIRTAEVEELFYKYGRINRCDVKRGASYSYGFVEFNDKRDAEDALRECDGMRISGCRIVVEQAKGNQRRGDERNCFKCGREGHWARDCQDKRRKKRGSHSPPNSRSRSRRHHRPSRSRSRSRSHSRSQTPPKRSSGRSHKRSRSRSRSRSGSPKRKPSSPHKRDRSGSPSGSSRSGSRLRSSSSSPHEKAGKRAISGSPMADIKTVEKGEERKGKGGEEKEKEEGEGEREVRERSASPAAED